MDYTIRSAERRDIDALEELERECFSVPWTRQQLTGQLPDERHVFLVADTGGEILGYVGMMHVLDEGYISNVAVAPEVRRRGIGAALIARLLQRAGELSLSFVTLEVRASNDAAIALYRRFGFEPVGRRRNYYDAPKEDAILMTSFLEKRPND